MIVPDQIRKCVGFLAAKTAMGTFQLLGTAFFVAYPEDATSPEDDDVFYAVTARHLIDGAKKQLLQETIYFRLNRWDRAVWVPILLDKWFTHPSDSSIDVAVVKIRMPTELDHEVIGRALIATDQLMHANAVGVGDEVFITGLFRHHHGVGRNVPIVRIGNLACMMEEKIPTNHFGDIDAYLVEARSIGGLSGSPVFVNLTGPRLVNEPNMTGGYQRHQFMLIGLIHGHYDVGGGETDGIAEDGGAIAHVNTGIAIVVPVTNVEAVLAAYETSCADAIETLTVPTTINPPSPDD